MSATTAGVILGILEAQHADCIVLSDRERIPLPKGLILESFPSGTSVTVIFTRDGDGKMAVQNITCTELARVPDQGLRA
jgi:hypothetical protein